MYAEIYLGLEGKSLEKLSFPTGTQFLITCACCEWQDAVVTGAICCFPIVESDQSWLMGKGQLVKWIYVICLSFLNLPSEHSIVELVVSLMSSLHC